MSPELGDSDDEELPTFDFLKQQPPSIKSVVQTPPLEENVVVLCSSDSEDSSVASPAWKKPRGSQDSARAPTCLKAIVQLSSESEEEEVIPLAERLKRKLLTSEPSSACPSYTRIRELSKQDSAGGNGLCSIDEKAVTDCGQLSQLPRCQGTHGRAVPSIWELSDSDQELDSLDPKKQTVLRPTVCVSDRLVQNGSCEAVEESLKPLPLQRKTKCSQEELGKARQRTNERETQKMLQQQERERRKALANRWKAQRPEECLKHIQAVLDPGTAPSLLALLGVNCLPSQRTPILVPALPFGRAWQLMQGVCWEIELLQAPQFARSHLRSFSKRNVLNWPCS